MIWNREEFESEPERELDVEWIELITMAKNMGFSTDEVRNIITECQASAMANGE